MAEPFIALSALTFNVIKKILIQKLSCKKMAGPFIALSALTFNVTEKIYENYLVKRWQEHLLFILSVLS